MGTGQPVILAKALNRRAVIHPSVVWNRIGYADVFVLDDPDVDAQTGFQARHCL
jgi:hypothetical protein